MKQSSLRVALGLCAAAALFSTTSVSAQVLFTGTYSQNFSSMASGTTAPTGWSVVSEAGSHNTFAPAGTSTVGVAPNFTAGTLSTQSVTFATPTQGSTGAKGIGGYNFANSLATAGNSEGSESLGSSPSGNAATILELSLTNTTGASMTDVNVSYDIDRFTTISNTNSVATGFPNTGVEEYPGYQLFYSLTPSVASSWVNVSALNPTIDMGTTGAVQVPNTVGITQVGTTDVTLNSAWTNGSNLTFAWFDDNAESPSPDQQIGLNNIVVAAVPEPVSGWLGLVAVGAAVILLRRRQQA